MMRVVLDVNVLVSGFPVEEGVPTSILSAWADLTFELVTSEHILDRAVNAWREPYFRARYSGAQVQETLVLLRSAAIVVIPDQSVHGIAPNAEDDLVLATAVAGRADYLVTGDGPFRRRVERYQGVILISPRDFLSLLEEQQGDDS